MKRRYQRMKEERTMSTIHVRNIRRQKEEIGENGGKDNQINYN